MIVQNTVLIYPIVLGTNKSASLSQIVQVVTLICLIVLSVKKSVKMRKLLRPEKLITDTK